MTELPKWAIERSMALCEFYPCTCAPSDPCDSASAIASALVAARQEGIDEAADAAHNAIHDAIVEIVECSRVKSEVAVAIRALRP